MFKSIFKTIFNIPIKLSGDHFVYLKWGITVMIDGEISKHFKKFSKWSNPITGAVCQWKLLIDGLFCNKSNILKFPKTAK